MFPRLCFQHPDVIRTVPLQTSKTCRAINAARIIFQDLPPYTLLTTLQEPVRTYKWRTAWPGYITRIKNIPDDTFLGFQRQSSILPFTLFETLTSKTNHPTTTRDTNILNWDTDNGKQGPHSGTRQALKSTIKSKKSAGRPWCRHSLRPSPLPPASSLHCSSLAGRQIEQTGPHR